MKKRSPTPPPQPCTVCGYKGTERRPAGENDIWQCSHLDCPNRRPVTAGPGDAKESARCLA